MSSSGLYCDELLKFVALLGEDDKELQYPGYSRQPYTSEDDVVFPPITGGDQTVSKIGFACEEYGPIIRTVALTSIARFGDTVTIKGNDE